MKCPYCYKFIFPKQRACPYCSSYLTENSLKNRKEVTKRWEELNAKFEYTEENVKKIADLNDLVSKKYIGMVESMYDKVRPVLLKFQNEGYEDYFEYKMRGSLALITDTETPYANMETHDKICEEIFYHKCPEPDYKMDYNDFNLFKGTIDYQELLKGVPHRGVFKHPAFDGIEICKSMDILFNEQRGYTLVDALYFEEKDIRIEIEIGTAKKLWKKDKKIWNKKFLFCPECHRLTLPGAKYCGYCHYPRLTRLWLEKKSLKHYRKTNGWRDFDWTYENKMKVYAVNDRITKLFDYMYDESFRVQKVFNELKAEGKTEFKTFEMTGFIKYLNREPTPLMNKKTARILNDAVNTHYVLHTSDRISNVSKWDEDKRLGNNLLGSHGDHLNWNIEGFDRSFVGEHPICYYMHSLFVDGDIYSINDIPYMNPEDFVPQFEIMLSNQDDYGKDGHSEE